MRFPVGIDDGDVYFYQERLSRADLLTGFDCGVEEYNKYLIEEMNKKSSKTISMRRDIWK